MEKKRKEKQGTTKEDPVDLVSASGDGEIIVISEEREGIIIKDNNLSGNYIATTRLSNMKDNMQVETLQK